MGVCLCFLNKMLLSVHDKEAPALMTQIASPPKAVAMTYFLPSPHHSPLSFHNSQAEQRKIIFYRIFGIKTA